MPSVKFFLDFEKDLKYILKYFPLFRKMSIRCFDKIIKSTYPYCYKKSDKEILDYFKKHEKEIIKTNKTVRNQLKQEWNKINDSFFKQVEKVTGFKWENKIYYCHVSSSYLYGGYNKPKAVIISSTTNEHIAMLAHELVHLHLLDVLRQLNIELNEKDYWKLSETMVPFIISKIKIKQVKHKKEINYSKLLYLYKKLKTLDNNDFKGILFDYVRIIKK